MLCPKCNYDNKSTNTRCEKCSEQLIFENQIQDTSFNSQFDIQNNPVQDAKIDSFAGVFSGVRNIMGGTIFSVASSMLVFKGENTIIKIVGIPFLICGIAVLIYGILITIKGINTKKKTDDYVNDKLDINKVDESKKEFEKLRKLVNNIYILSFLLFWFGILIVIDILAIKSWSDGGSGMFFGSLIFFGVGIYIFLTKFKK